jgi:hypothetical protein
MHRAKLKFIIIPVLFLAATVAISSTVSEDSFARDGGRYSGGDGTSQAAAVSNDCLNPILDSNTIDNMVGVGNCGGTVSQQDESGQAGATTTHQTAKPTIELQRSTTQSPITGNPPQTCEECFDVLTATQQSAFEAELAQDPSPLPSPPFTGDPLPSTIEELCEQWKEFSPRTRALFEPDLVSVFVEAGIPESIYRTILSCLVNSVG